MHVRIADFCHRKYGEGQLVYVDGKLVTWWSANDAQYRAEYMDSMLEALGATVESATATAKEVKQAMED